MKDIRIFVASSKELERERNYLAYLVLAKAEEFERRGFRVRLSKWEYVDPKMTKERTEDRYLAEMYACDAALILFRNVAGMYTREEMDKALATEQAGTERLKAHRILFSEGADGNSDAAKLRASLPEGSYGTFRDFSDLREGFLALVERVAAMDDLVEVDESGLRTVSAFLAADDELAADRDAFADMVLNLNDILARRGVRVKLRFYDSARHREMLEFSEMALVLYRTNFNAFGPEQMREAYDRTKREENPRRLYVFFRDGDDITSDEEFAAFRDGFAENIGHFFCRFENADTLKLNFLLSLENALGEGASFVKLDGRRVMADNLEVGDLTSLPMVAKNEGLSSIMAELDALGAKFAEQRRRCNEDPLNDTLYGELMDLSVRKNELQQQVDRELSLSLSLAKRMAAISVAEANDTIMRARAKMEEGRIKEAIEILDGASSSLRRRRILRRAEERVDEVAQEIKELAAGNEVEFFRVEAVMSYTGMPFNERFKKSESIYSMLAEDIEAYSESCPSAHKLEVDAMLADILRRFAELYDEVADTLTPIPLLEKALKLYCSIENLDQDNYRYKSAVTYMALARLERENNRLQQSLEHYESALDVYRQQDSQSTEELAECLHGLANLHADTNNLPVAEREYTEALDILRCLVKVNPLKFEIALAASMNQLANLYFSMGRLDDAEKIYFESLSIRRRLAAETPAKFKSEIHGILNNLACLHTAQNRLSDAEHEYFEALSICRSLAEKNPARFESDVAMSLNNLAILHEDMNCLSDAECEYIESLAIRRRLAKVNAAKYMSHMAESLYNLAFFHQKVNRPIDAEREYIESLGIWRTLTLENSEKFESFVALTLHGMGEFYQEIHRLDSASDCFYEALKILKSLAIQNHDKFIANVAGVMHSTGMLERDRERIDQAESLFVGALSLFRELARSIPEEYEASVANTLVEYAKLHRDYGSPDKASAEFTESLDIRRRLAKANPEKFNEPVSESLTGIAVLHAQLGELDAAIKEIDEAIAIRKALSEGNHDKFDEKLAESLHEKGKMLLTKGDRQNAVNCLEVALSIRMKLAADNPEKFGKDLKDTEEVLSKCS